MSITLRDMVRNNAIAWQNFGNIDVIATISFDENNRPQGEVFVADMRRDENFFCEVFCEVCECCEETIREVFERICKVYA